jgi:hypothetical protein
MLAERVGPNSSIHLSKISQDGPAGRMRTDNLNQDCQKYFLLMLLFVFISFKKA